MYNINEIEKILDNLINTISTCKKRDKKYYIYDTLNYLKIYLLLNGHKDYESLISDEDYNSLTKVLEQYRTRNNNEFCNSLSFLGEISNSYLKIFRENNKPIYENEDEKIYSYKDTRDILISFYNSIDSKYGNLVKRMFDGQNVYWISNESSYNGLYLSSCITKLNNIIINGNPNNINLSTLEDLSHELGHAVAFNQLNYSKRNKLKYNYGTFVEVPSTTYEKLFLDYVKENKIDNYIDSQILIFLNRNKIYLDQINILKEIKEIQIDEKDDIITGPLKGCNIRLMYAYTYGFVISLIYSNMYKDNPKETIENLNLLIKYTPILNYLEMFNNFGLDVDEAIKGKELKRELH